MIDRLPPPSGSLVLDATCLIHFSRADRLDVLREILVGDTCATTAVVLDELREGMGAGFPMPTAQDLEWLTTVDLDSMEELLCYVKWSERIGSGARDKGEASVCAAAELATAVAVLDDDSAKGVARSHGLDAHGTLWLLARAHRAGKLTAGGAGNIVDMLRGTGMRLPCDGSGFDRWARRTGLL